MTAAPRRSVPGAALGRVVLVAAAALALGTALLGADPAPSARRAPAAEVVTGPARVAGDAFLAHYEQPDGRVVRWDQGGDTVSEGQAYALLVSVALGRAGRFGAAWRWARDHLRQPTGLFAWHWAHARVVDPSSATDADVEIAWALALAAHRFGRPAYAAPARSIAQAVVSHEVVTVPGAEVPVAGPWALGPPPTTNPSYDLPVASARLGALTDTATWGALRLGAQREVAALLAAHPLPPDWAELDGQGRPVPVGKPGGSAGPRYGYGAARLAVQLAQSCDRTDRSLAARMWPVLRRRADAHRPLVDLTLGGATDRPRQAPDVPIGLVGAAGAAEAAHQPRAAARLLDRAAAANRAHPTYYGTAWVALGRLLLQTRALGGCSPGAAR